MKRRVLIISGGLQIGGAERVTANISQYAPADEFEFHYLIFKGHDNVYGKEIKDRGGEVFEISPPAENYFLYIKRIGSMMHYYNYSAVHSHTMFNSGINLSIANIFHVPVRIAHSHTTKTDTKVSKLQKIYEIVMQKLIVLNATDLFACGRDAGIWLYGEKAFERKGKIVFNGIDIDNNKYDIENRKKYRKLLNAENKFVIGHVGSLLHVKNQIFLIQIMPEILRRRQDAVLVLLGEGEDRDYLSCEIERLGLERQVILYGSTMEVHGFLSAFDVFAFPSLREGTPLSVLEAETNGLPCIISDNVPSDVILTNLITRLSLDNVEEWVNKICSSKRNKPEDYASIMSETGYSSSVSYLPIYEAYRRGKNRWKKQ